MGKRGAIPQFPLIGTLRFYADQVGEIEKRAAEAGVKKAQMARGIMDLGLYPDPVERARVQAERASIVENQMRQRAGSTEE